mmetsp:Transcript_23940/g.53649  ORF Transcript_23940/g.53649 Transcript_23940/m.53649 type:complete len:96 (-) Transcript_23940:1812-2099(-)
MRDKPFRELQDLYDRGCLTYNEYLSELAMLKRQKIFAMKGEIVEEEPFWMQFLPIRRITEEEIEMHAEHCRRIELAKKYIDHEKLRQSYEDSLKE